MSGIFKIFLASLTIINCSMLKSQSVKGFSCTKIADYSECAAILINDKMLVDEFSPSGKCTLEKEMKGNLSVATVHLSDEGARPLNNVKFQIAIYNKRTNTMRMFSQESYKSVAIESVLKGLEIEDEIVIMTVNKEYSLSHHRIGIVWGC